MFDLAAHIEYLLMRHDCVVTPGLGAFLVHETPAYYDCEQCRFYPPSRSLGFNAAVTLNDGLLAESVARRDGVSLDEARLRVESSVSSFRNQLEQSHSLPVGNLGVMTLEDGKLVFEPASSSAVSMRYMGLGALNITPLVNEVHVGYDDEVEDKPTRRNFTSLTLKIAASFIIAIMACGIFFTTDRLIGDRSANFASLDSGLRAHVGNLSRVPSQPAETLSLSREIELNIAMPEQETVVNAASPAAEPTLSSSDRYLLVVASFADMSSALRHIGDDRRLSVKEMDGNYRVCVASAGTISKAHEQADALRSEFPSIWICRR